MTVVYLEVRPSRSLHDVSPEMNHQASDLGLSFHKNFAWTLAGNITYAACQWAVLIIIAKVGSSAMVGQFALGLAVSAPILTLTNLQLRPIQATDTQGRFGFADYLTLRLMTAFLAFVMICGSAVMFRSNPATASVVLVVGVAKCIESVSDALYGQLQRSDRMDRIAISMMLKGPLSLAAMAIAVWVTGRVLWGATALAGVWLLLGLSYDLPAARKTVRPESNVRTSQSVIKWRPHILMTIVRIGLPMGLALMLLALATNIPKYLVQRELGEGALGYFSALAYPGYGIALLVAALGQSASTRLARAFAGGGNSFGRLLLTLAGITLGIGAVAVGLVITLGPQILSIMYRPDYSAFSNVFAVLTIATVIWSVEAILGYGATAGKVYYGQAWAGGIAAAVTALSGVVLVRSYGLLGAAWATAFGGFTALSVFFVLVLRATMRRRC